MDVIENITNLKLCQSLFFKYNIVN